ncbi:imidazole glycerol phosphate synthase subunit HisH [Pedobacter hiemivivus]|uniref:Imidazole glycerol phosphate synthase subunit HisH n=1 Tax=Pedobacter hiemivivus TaxID=2530454 RepID=A0A4R0NE93_9SPHI|nr:imidazole glycerol phosphate synthase subunit HisH [Pedobacter hiemivivus]TCC98759.1 imidazole glycerol phosphate synthase subunit HisH [Pedobacter hiemivivus]TKC65399.1 imidazole glycerol phosphate synthase subunit HisH [Pedobacter hiemivivus]
MIGIVNYGAGNIFSLTSALERLSIPFGMVNTEADLDLYTHIIIPGVGHAGAAMKKLEQTGLVAPIKALKKPVLGICVGMQLLTEHSEEGNADLMGIVPIQTRLFDKHQGIKIPHMGWNNISHQNNLLFEGVESDTQFYFVHSYFIEYNATFDIATADYGMPFSAAIQKNNFYGVQFHPEKSGIAGERLLMNFSNLKQ